MVFLELQDERIAQRLQQVAQRHGQSLDHLLEDWLDTLDDQEVEGEVMLTKNGRRTPSPTASEANLQFSGLPQNFDSDAYLHENFADELLRKMNR